MFMVSTFNTYHRHYQYMWNTSVTQASKDLISALAPLSTMPRLDYPAPLYIVDRVARVNSDFRGMVRLIMEKLGGDVLSELRGMYLRMNLNDYVKSN